MTQISLNINADSVNELNKALADFLKGRFMAKIEVTPEQETKLTAAVKDAAAEAADNKALTQSAKAAEDIINKAEAKAEEKPKKAKKAETDEDGFRPATPEDEVPKKFTQDTAIDVSDLKVYLTNLVKTDTSFREKFKKVFKEYGVSKLSELCDKYPDKLEEFKEKVEAL